MNRTITVEIRDIPDEVWTFLVNQRGSEKSADELIIETITSKIVVSLKAYYEFCQAEKAGISLESLIPKVLDEMIEGSEVYADTFKIELEKQFYKLTKGRDKEGCRG